MVQRAHRPFLPASACLAVLLFAAGQARAQAAPAPERWRFELGPTERPLPFVLELEPGQRPRAFVLNGPERLEVPKLEISADSWRLEFPHYDSRLELSRAAPERLEGHWIKRRAGGLEGRMQARAQRGGAPRFAALPAGGAPPAAFLGEWRLRFESDPHPAIGRFAANAEGEIEGTVLTSTGDHRFLAGSAAGGRLRLSVFDGAHAFLYDLALTEDGRLEGRFHSGERWSEGLSGERAPAAALADAFGLLSQVGAAPLKTLELEDLQGQPLFLGGPEFAGRPLLIQVFGSWCPNCHDEAALLAELHGRFGPRGLALVGLASEFGDDPARDRAQVQRYAERHGLSYPLALLSKADKAAAGEALGLSGPLVAFPTTLFVARDGSLAALHSGFSGPATGADHQRLRAEFEQMIEALLEAEAPPAVPLKIREWVAWGHTGASYRIEDSPEGPLWARLDDRGRVVSRGEASEAWPGGVRLDGETFVFDPALGVFVHPWRADWRLAPAGSTLTPSVWRFGDPRSALLQRASEGTPVERREALLALCFVERENAGADLDPLLAAGLSSQSPASRASACAAAALAGRRALAPAIEALQASADSRLARAAREALASLAREPAPAGERSERPQTER
jgi:thiol-disulfide isomerase/thioredoxin